ncbi:MAG: transcription termination factor Rho, partial [Actinobacteria bacterium]|nr:transcription termination factor Rho [Actinomycetota bacterium]
MAAPQLGRAQLEEKDRDDLIQIAKALGLKGVSAANKADLIAKILEETMAPQSDDKPQASAKPLGADGEPLADWEVELAEHEGTPIAPDARVRGGDRGDSRGGDR